MDDRAIRYRCDIQGRLERAGARHPVRILQLSEGGAFIETDVDLQFGERATLTIPLPGGDPWHAEVTVVRLGRSQRELRHPRVENFTVTRPGVGVTFDHVPDDEVERLRGFLELLDER